MGKEDLELKVIRAHPHQKTVLCPYCHKEGSNMFAKKLNILNTSVPGKCPECEESFIVQMVDDPEKDNPLRAMAVAIWEMSNTWDNKEIDLVSKVKQAIEAVAHGLPGLRPDERPKFRVFRNNNGNVEFQPDNNPACRVMDFVEEMGSPIVKPGEVRIEGGLTEREIEGV